MIGAPRSRLARWDVAFLAGITTFAFLLRLLSPIMPDFLTNPGSPTPIRVYGLGHPYQAPNGYIFDEVYFAQDACKDLIGRDYLDPEPPLAKLFIAAGIVVAGTWMHYDRGVTVEPGKECETAGTLPGFGTWGWRLASLVFGTALVPLVYLIARRLWSSRVFAASAAILMSLDGMAFVQSRIGMIDAVALAFLMVAYYLFLVHRDAASDSQWWRSLAFLSIAIGLSVSAKWTTLAAAGTMLLLLVGGWAWRTFAIDEVLRPWLGRISPPPEPRPEAPRVGVRDQFARAYIYMLFLMVIPAVIYAGSYFRYNSIPQCVSVVNDAKHHDFRVPNPCQPGQPAPPAALPLAKVGPIWVPTGIDVGRYIDQIVIHDEWTYDYHATLTATHTYGSKWWTWPLLLRPVAYYYADGLGVDSLAHESLREEVFNLGNPAIWWAAIPALIFCAYMAVRRRSWPAAFIVLAFLSAWLPFARVTRVMFLYHMFGPLPPMILAVAFSLASLKGMRLRLTPSGSLVIRGSHLVAAYLGLVALTFCYMYPLWAALPITGDAWYHRIWINLPPVKKILNLFDPGGTISWI